MVRVQSVGIVGFGPVSWVRYTPYSAHGDAGREGESRSTLAPRIAIYAGLAGGSSEGIWNGHYCIYKAVFVGLQVVEHIIYNTRPQSQAQIILRPPRSAETATKLPQPRIKPL